jgi:hypothetical protein
MKRLITDDQIEAINRKWHCGGNGHFDWAREIEAACVARQEARISEIEKERDHWKRERKLMEDEYWSMRASNNEFLCRWLAQEYEHLRRKLKDYPALTMPNV